MSTSNSHPATRQDIWVLQNLGRDGTFLEVGAYDGLKHSNTLLLEQHGWVGTLIEGHNEFADLCKQNRPLCVTHQVMIGDGRSHKFVVGGQYSGLENNMPKLWLREHAARNNPRYTVKTRPLAEVIGTTPVNYLSIDIEGGEDSVLEEWFNAGGDADAITVEFRYDRDYLRQLEFLMLDHDLELSQVRGFDACFLKKGLVC